VIAWRSGRELLCEFDTERTDPALVLLERHSDETDESTVIAHDPETSSQPVGQCSRLHGLHDHHGISDQRFVCR
jgi:hypothetical protein